jgi:hypothetical protein
MNGGNYDRKTRLRWTWTPTKWNGQKRIDTNLVRSSLFDDITVSTYFLLPAFLLDPWQVRVNIYRLFRRGVNRAGRHVARPQSNNRKLRVACCSLTVLQCCCVRAGFNTLRGINSWLAGRPAPHKRSVPSQHLGNLKLKDGLKIPSSGFYEPTLLLYTFWITYSE